MVAALVFTPGLWAEDAPFVLDDYFLETYQHVLNATELNTLGGQIYLFGCLGSDNGFTLEPLSPVSGLDSLPGGFDLNESDFQPMKNYSLRTTAFIIIIDDGKDGSIPDSRINGIFPDGEGYTIPISATQTLTIDRNFVKQRSYFEAYLLLALAGVIDIDIESGGYPLPFGSSISQFEVFLYDEQGNREEVIYDPSILMERLAELEQDESHRVINVRIEGEVAADANLDGTPESTLYIPVSVYSTSHVTSPLKTEVFQNWLASVTLHNGTTDQYVDPRFESSFPDTTGVLDGVDTNPSWWRPDLIRSDSRDEGEKGFDVDWWRDLELLSVIPGLGINDVSLWNVDPNGSMEDDENRAVLFERTLRQNGYRLTDTTNTDKAETLEDAYQDKIKSTITLTGTITFGDNYDGSTHIVGTHTIGSTLTPEEERALFEYGVVPPDTQYRGDEKNYSDYLTNIHVYLPSKLDESWMEVTVAQLLQAIGEPWDKDAFFSNPNSLNYPGVDPGLQPGTMYLISGTIDAPTAGLVNREVTLLCRSYTGLYTTNFYGSLNLGGVVGVEPTPTPTPEVWKFRDLNGDGMIGYEELIHLYKKGTSFSELWMISQQWQKEIQTPTPTPTQEVPTPTPTNTPSDIGPFNIRDYYPMANGDTWTFQALDGQTDDTTETAQGNTGPNGLSVIRVNNSVDSYFDLPDGSTLEIAGFKTLSEDLVLFDGVFPTESYGDVDTYLYIPANTDVLFSQPLTMGTGEIFVGTNFDDVADLSIPVKGQLKIKVGLFPLTVNVDSAINGQIDSQVSYLAAGEEIGQPTAPVLFTDTLRGHIQLGLDGTLLLTGLPGGQSATIPIQIESAGFAGTGEVIWAKNVGPIYRFSNGVEFGLKRAEVGGTVYESKDKGILARFWNAFY